MQRSFFLMLTAFFLLGHVSRSQNIIEVPTSGIVKYKDTLNSAYVDTFYVSISGADLPLKKDTLHSANMPKRLFRVSLSADFSSMKTLSLKLGSRPGLGNILDIGFEKKSVNGKTSLVWEEKSFPIANKQVTIELEIATKQILGTNFLSILGKDNSGVQAQLVSKKIN